MNLISLANLSQPENQSQLPAPPKEETHEDFSAILQSIGLALQTVGSPVNAHSNLEPAQTVSSGEVNFVQTEPLSENLFLPDYPEKPISLQEPFSQINLSTITGSEESASALTTQNEPSDHAFNTEPTISFPPAEILNSNPANFQPLPKLPTIENLSDNQSAENLPPMQIELSDGQGFPEIETPPASELHPLQQTAQNNFSGEISEAFSPHQTKTQGGNSNGFAAVTVGEISPELPVNETSPKSSQNNQTNLLANEFTHSEKIEITATDSENGPQNFSFGSKSEEEKNLNESDLSIKFDRILENIAGKKPAIQVNQEAQIEPAQIIEQVTPQILELAELVEKTNEKELLKLRLHPAELGAVEITLERDGSGVLNAHFKTENAEAQQILSNGLEQLRDNLQNSGWEIGNLEISSTSTSTTDNQNRQSNQPKSEWIENFVFSRSSEKPDETESLSPIRLLNLLA